MNIFFDIKANELKLMNLSKESLFLLYAKNYFNNNNYKFSRKKLFIIYDVFDKKCIYKKSDEIDNLLKFSYFGSFSPKAEKEQDERVKNPKKTRGRVSPEKDPKSEGFVGRRFSKAKNRMYYNTIRKLQLE